MDTLFVGGRFSDRFFHLHARRLRSARREETLEKRSHRMCHCPRKRFLSRKPTAWSCSFHLSLFLDLSRKCYRERFSNPSCTLVQPPNTCPGVLPQDFEIENARAASRRLTPNCHPPPKRGCADALSAVFFSCTSA